MSKKNEKILPKLINIEQQELKAYECEGCNSIIKSLSCPSKCPVCDCDEFNLLTPNNNDIKLKVLSEFSLKRFGVGTEILVTEILLRNYIYTTKVDKASEIYIYKDGIYVPEGESEIKQQLRIIMEENYSEWLSNQIISKIKTDTYIDSERFFEDRNILEVPVQNGILDLKEIVLNPFTPDKIFFSKLPVIYNPLVRVDKIDKFLSEVFACPEDKEVFYELAGFGLVKDYFLEKAIMFVGNGRNGKSKTIELLKKFVGVENCASVPLSAITHDSPFVQRLWKRFFNLAGDISSDDLKETGMFKQLTGRDSVSANRKYKNIVEFTNYAKMVFACNDLPKVYDYSDGFWERWVLLEFPYKFVDKEVYERERDKSKLKIKDSDIINKITTEEEMSGLLNEAIIGLHKLMKEQKFSYTIGTSGVKDRWIRKADSFMAFCMDCVEEDYDSKITKNKLRSEYKRYCSKHKVTGAGDKAIKATLQERFGAGEGYAITDGVHQEYCWTGIKFRDLLNEK